MSELDKNPDLPKFEDPFVHLKFIASCMYCGYTWKGYYSQYTSKTIRCDRCKDKKIRLKRLTDEDSDVFGYYKK